VTRATAIDWDLGCYERTAEQLMPAARLLVGRAAPVGGERVVDVGCGTGNAALLAAEQGARVTGVDPAARLLEVARAEAAARGLDADFVPGDAAELPLADGEADLVLSVFGVIFAPDPRAAAAEMARVTAPDGRIVLSAWIPEGAISTVNRIARQAVAEALELPPAPAPFAWHEPDALADLFREHGFGVSLDEHTLAFTGPSPSEFLQAESENHPVALAGRAVLEPRGEGDALFARMLQAVEEANEDPAAFRVTSRFVIVSARRGG
jgi:SAM-dependent methyltransferase